VDGRRVTNGGLVDTAPDADAVLIEGYRQVDGREKLRRVVSLNRSVERLARARIRAQYGPRVTEREMGVLKVAGASLDVPYLRRTAALLGVERLLDRAIEEVGQEDRGDDR
jgi:hypothetical protein